MNSSSNQENKNTNVNQNKYDNPPQIILNICYNPETGKLTLSDNYNNHYSCDLFGRITKKFFPNVTGQASYRERKIKTEEKYKMPKTTNIILRLENSMDILTIPVPYPHLFAMYQKIL